MVRGGRVVLFEEFLEYYKGVADEEVGVVLREVFVDSFDLQIC